MLDDFYGRLDRWTQRRWFLPQFLLLILVLTIFLQPPTYGSFIKHVAHGTSAILTYFAGQIAHPFTAQDVPPGTHAAKMVFRLVPPLLARALHVNLYGMAIVQLLIGLTMFAALYRLLARELADRVTALLFCLGLSGVYFGHAYATDLAFHFDPIAYTALIAMMLTSRPLTIFALGLVAGFTDERALLALVLVLFWHLTRGAAEGSSLRLPDLLRRLKAPPVLAVVGAWGAYVVLRLVLARTFALPTHLGAVGAGPLITNLQGNAIPLAVFACIESYWLFILLLAGLLLMQRQWAAFALYTGTVVALLVGACLVFNMTNSMAYVFPAAVIGVVALHRQLAARDLRNLTLIVAAYALLIPSYKVTGDVIEASSWMDLIARYGLHLYSLPTPPGGGG